MVKGQPVCLRVPELVLLGHPPRSPEASASAVASVRRGVLAATAQP